MDCPQCGYAMGPLDVECARCRRMGPPGKCKVCGNRLPSGETLCDSCRAGEAQHQAESQLPVTEKLFTTIDCSHCHARSNLPRPMKGGEKCKCGVCGKVVTLSGLSTGDVLRQNIEEMRGQARQHGSAATVFAVITAILFITWLLYSFENHAP